MIDGTHLPKEPTTVPMEGHSPKGQSRMIYNNYFRRETMNMVLLKVGYSELNIRMKRGRMGLYSPYRILSISNPASCNKKQISLAVYSRLWRK